MAAHRRRPAWRFVPGRVVRGHGVASGEAGDPRYPEGTVALQLPVFAALGLDLTGYHPATLNVSVEPCHVEVVRPLVTFQAVRWSPHVPPEDFSFFDCRVRGPQGSRHRGLVYRPHPETKPEHHQPPGVLEILTDLVPGVGAGVEITVGLDPAQLAVLGGPG